MDKKLRVGVIGAGYVSKNNYLPVLAQREDIEFVGIMARNYENALRAQRSFGAEHAVKTIEELAALGIDCAFVLTPKQVHAQQVTYLMNAMKERGWPVKTDATTVEEAVREICASLDMPV